VIFSGGYQMMAIIFDFKNLPSEELASQALANLGSWE
jgi:hypothetical protein